MSEYEQSIFISYAWGEENDEREKIVNELDQSLQNRGLRIVRDKRNLGYRGSIRKFMEKIGEGDCVITVISDKYLRSKNCMYELVEIAENKEFADRIFPIILEDAKIYDAGDRIDYINYWAERKAVLRAKADALQDPSNAISILEEERDYARFHYEIDELTNTLKDMNCLTPDLLREADFQQLYDALQQRMTRSSSSSAASHSKKERKPMDPITLATAATTLLAPFIKKAGTAAMDRIAEKFPDAVGKVWDAISKKSSNAAEAAGDLAKNPDDTDNEVFFRKQLQKALEKDQEFANLLADLVDNAKNDPSINIGGDGVVATNNSTAVGKVSIGGNVNGNFVIGNNNQ
jgi:hypothetical protein